MNRFMIWLRRSNLEALRMALFGGGSSRDVAAALDAERKN